MASSEDRLKISWATFIAAWLLVIILEVGAGLAARAAGLGPLPATLLTRILQAFFLLVLVRLSQAGLAGIGLAPGTYLAGLKAGLIWSAAFGGIAAAMGAAMLIAGHNPLTLFNLSLAKSHSGLLNGLFGFYITGAIFGPVTEEIVFRGMTYGFFRRWGKIVGIVLSTTCFVLLHAPQSIPVTQAVGGIVFCLAYEKEKSLLAPIIIHMLGNAALFTLGIL